MQSGAGSGVFISTVFISLSGTGKTFPFFFMQMPFYYIMCESFALIVKLLNQVGINLKKASFVI